MLYIIFLEISVCSYQMFCLKKTFFIYLFKMIIFHAIFTGHKHIITRGVTSFKTQLLANIIALCLRTACVTCFWCSALNYSDICLNQTVMNQWLMHMIYQEQTSLICICMFRGHVEDNHDITNRVCFEVLLYFFNFRVTSYVCKYQQHLDFPLHNPLNIQIWISKNVKLNTTL